MRYLTTDSIFLGLEVCLEIFLIVVLFKRSLLRDYRFFTTYLLLDVVEDPLVWALRNQAIYLQVYFALTLLDYLFQFLILLEIARNVLRPAKKAVPASFGSLAVVALLISGIIAVSASPHVAASGLQYASKLFLQTTVTLAVLQILLFLALAGFSQMLGISWKNHVLQLASGLGLYGVASLFVQLSVAHLSASDHAAYLVHYVTFMRVQGAAYNVILIFWIWAFSRNEAPRKEFTPQMQEVLVTIAQSAKRTRLAITRSSHPR